MTFPTKKSDVFDILRIFAQARNRSMINKLEVNHLGNKYKWSPLRIDTKSKIPEKYCVENIGKKYRRHFSHEDTE